ncbi:peptide chain release factor 2 [Paracholeplasma manati]|jgi:peptide chain release factor 2|uniref:peptide chain release factor 2 n=1 Tax=Paracholeplasma manati TaxID=591373 RepID=UPI002407C790|nr:peptide chain release factor 2 [Paracholeplasma manati]MDG0887989.1 peptide chain release factor 2 [Paracholeplasma manati]MDX9807661.1 peptide chain release factor 2 [Acholeplasma sp.]
MERYELNKYLESFDSRLADLQKALDMDNLKQQFLENSRLMSAADFWDDVKSAQKMIEKTNQQKEQIDTYESLYQQYKALEELAAVTDDQSEDFLMITDEVYVLDKALKTFETLTLLNEPYDDLPAILELHPGAGGTESQDWCEMLYRMYQRYAVRKNYKIEVLDYQAGEEAGIKSVTIRIKGKYAYGYLKSEHGVHRLVRISPFDSNARRHTSFVSVEVMPEIDQRIDIQIKEEDIKVDVYRSSGAGGQSVNTTDSAVRVTHLPTNIVVTCQNERSQIKNKEVAMDVLRSKLAVLEIEKQKKLLSEIKGEQKDIGWGSQIRSYVFHPYQMVKDHRTDYETSQTVSVMDGEIDGFINAYLKSGD